MFRIILFGIVISIVKLSNGGDVFNENFKCANEIKRARDMFRYRFKPSRQERNVLNLSITPAQLKKDAEELNRRVSPVMSRFASARSDFEADTKKLHENKRSVKKNSLKIEKLSVINEELSLKNMQDRSRSHKSTSSSNQKQCISPIVKSSTKVGVSPNHPKINDNERMKSKHKKSRKKSWPREDARVEITPFQQITIRRTSSEESIKLTNTPEKCVFRNTTNDVPKTPATIKPTIKILAREFQRPKNHIFQDTLSNFKENASPELDKKIGIRNNDETFNLSDEKKAEGVDQPKKVVPPDEMAKKKNHDEKENKGKDILKENTRKPVETKGNIVNEVASSPDEPKIDRKIKRKKSKKRRTENKKFPDNTATVQRDVENDEKTRENEETIDWDKTETELMPLLSAEQIELFDQYLQYVSTEKLLSALEKRKKVPETESNEKEESNNANEMKLNERKDANSKGSNERKDLSKTNRNESSNRETSAQKKTPKVEIVKTIMKDKTNDNYRTITSNVKIKIGATESYKSGSSCKENEMDLESNKLDNAICLISQNITSDDNTRQDVTISLDLTETHKSESENNKLKISDIKILINGIRKDIRVSNFTMGGCLQLIQSNNSQINTVVVNEINEEEKLKQKIKKNKLKERGEEKVTKLDVKDVTNWDTELNSDAPRMIKNDKNYSRINPVGIQFGNLNPTSVANSVQASQHNRRVVSTSNSREKAAPANEILNSDATYNIEGIKRNNFQNKPTLEDNCWKMAGQQTKKILVDASIKNVNVNFVSRRNYPQQNAKSIQMVSWKPVRNSNLPPTTPHVPNNNNPNPATKSAKMNAKNNSAKSFAAVARTPLENNDRETADKQSTFVIDKFSQKFYDELGVLQMKKLQREFGSRVNNSTRKLFKLIQLVVVSRHGIRAPFLMRSQGDVNFNPYSCVQTPPEFWDGGDGQLTKEGILGMQMLGNRLRRRYHDFIHPLSGENYRNDVRFVSTPLERCQQSARAVAHRLCHPHEDKIRLDIELLDIVANRAKVCPRLDDERAKSAERVGTQYYFDLMRLFPSHVPVNRENLFHLMDNIICEAAMNVSHPEWIVSLLKSEEFIKYKHLSWAKYTANDCMKRLRMGPTIHSVTFNIIEAIREISSAKKMCFYSAHDTTVHGIIHTLAPLNSRFKEYHIDFGASLIFEVYKYDMDAERPQYYIRTLYGTNTTLKHIIALKFKECDEICHSNIFFKRLAPYIPSDWGKECRIN